MYIYEHIQLTSDFITVWSFYYYYFVSIFLNTIRYHVDFYELSIYFSSQSARFLWILCITCNRPFSSREKSRILS